MQFRRTVACLLLSVVLSGVIRIWSLVNDRSWPKPATRQVVYSAAGTDPKRTFGFFSI